MVIMQAPNMPSGKLQISKFLPRYALPCVRELEKQGLVLEGSGFCGSASRAEALQLMVCRVDAELSLADKFCWFWSFRCRRLLSSLLKGDC